MIFNNSVKKKIKQQRLAHAYCLERKQWENISQEKSEERGTCDSIRLKSCKVQCTKPKPRVAFNTAFELGSSKVSDGVRARKGGQGDDKTQNQHTSQQLFYMLATATRKMKRIPNYFHNNNRMYKMSTTLSTTITETK